MFCINENAKEAGKFKPLLSLVSAALASTEEHAQIKSMAIPVPAAQASLGRTANTKSMNATPSLVLMEAFVKMAWSPSAALVPKVILATAARYRIKSFQPPPRQLQL